MEFYQLISFIGFCTLANCIPGPDMILVMNHTLTSGRIAGLTTTFGIVSGLIVHVSFAFLGISSLLATSPQTLLIIKVMGSGYIIYLSIKILMDKKFRALPTFKSKSKSFKKIFFQAFFTNILNPKVGLFVLAIFPQFMSSASNRFHSQLFILGSTLILITFLNFSILTFFVEYYNKIFNNHTNQKLQRWVFSSGLAISALYLAFSKN